MRTSLRVRVRMCLHTCVDARKYARIHSFKGVYMRVCSRGPWVAAAKAPDLFVWNVFQSTMTLCGTT